MKEIKCLWLEHDEKSFQNYSEPVRTRWNSIFDIRLEITHILTIEEAFKELDKPEATYQIFISDVLFPPVYQPEAERQEHEKRGLEAIAKARKKGKLLVVAYSYGLPQKFGNAIRKEAKETAHIFKYIGDIYGVGKMGISPFCHEMYNGLLREDIIEDPIKLVYDADDPKISYIVNEIGEGPLKSLYKSIYRKAVGEEAQLKEISTEYIAPGMSGAFVIKMIATDEKKLKVHHLLKISRNKEALLKEIKNYPKPGIYGGRLLVKYLGDPISDDNLGWCALGAVFEKDTISMLEWLYGAGREEDVSNVMNSLFLDGGLINGYVEDSSDPEKPQNAVSVLSPNLSQQAQILLSMEGLDKVIRTPGLGGDKNWNNEILRKYLKFKQIGIINERQTPKKCYMCQCHGDLHSRNILVTKGKPHVAVIIDTSEFNIHHWAIDYAKLLVDLLLCVYDRGVRSYEWCHMEHWMELSSAIIRLQNLPSDNRTGGSLKETGANDNFLARAAINWMINNLSKVCPAVQTSEKLKERLWELQLAIGIELMLGSFRLDLTPPKRVFSLKAAREAVSATEFSFFKVFGK